MGNFKPKSRISIKLDPAEVGQAFAYTDDEAQAIMINEMAVELKACCGGDFGMQVCAFSKLLDSHGKKLIKDIAGFIKLRDEDHAI